MHSTPEPSKADDRGTATFFAAMNIIGACAFLALGLTLAISGLSFGLVRANLPGPGLFPFLLGVITVFLAVLWLVKKKLRSPMMTDEDSPPPSRRGITIIGATLVAGVGFIALLEAAGYQLTMLLFTGALLKVVAQRGWISTILISAVFSFGSFQVFVAMLGVPLPVAQIPFLNNLGL